MSVHPAAAGLPDAMLALAPELASGPLPDEPLADCAACPMAGKPFLPDVRCCTFHPVLPNFLVGRALRRGGAGAERIRARLAQRDGVERMGIGPPAGWRHAYEQDRDEAFGRRPEWTCPYWVEGPLSCSVWADRNSTCRSWHCRHAAGAAGQRVWADRRQLGRHVEAALARMCVDAAGGDGEPAEGWEAWYVACADRVDAATPEDLAPLASPLLAARRADAARPIEAEPPAVLTPAVRSARPRPDGAVELVGYSDWDPAVVPTAAYALLAALDGRPWREAIAGFAEGEAWVLELWRGGAVRPP